MLKTLSLLPEAGGDADTQNNSESESRMLRSLEALGPSRGAAPATASGAGAFHGPTPAAPAASRGTGPRSPRDNGRDSARDAGNMHQARARHRFVKDGEVPVVHMAVPRAAAAGTRDAEHVRLQQALDESKARVEQAERARNEAQLQLRLLQTKFAHLEMAVNDSTLLAESRLQQITQLEEKVRQAASASLTAASPSRAVPDETIDAAHQLFRLPAEDIPAGSPAVTDMRPAHEIKGDAPPAMDEPEPVQWWLTPAKAQTRRGRPRG